MTTPVEPTWPDITSCGDDPSAVCDWVLDRTDNERLAAAADWFIGRPFKIVGIVIVAWLVSKLLRRLIVRGLTRVADSSVVRDPRAAARSGSIAGVVASAVSFAIWTIAIFLIVGQLGIDLAPLIAGAGIAGVALGFGAQTIVRDFLSGLFMIIEDQYGVGDTIDVGEAVGVVERVTLRTTVVRGVDGTLWYVPNGNVQRVGNRSQLWSVALLDVAIAPNSPVDAAKAAILAAADEVVTRDEFAPDVLEAPSLLGVESVTPEAISLRLLVKTKPGTQFDLQRALREAISAALAEVGIAQPMATAALWSRLAAQPPASFTGPVTGSPPTTPPPKDPSS